MGVPYYAGTRVVIYNTDLFKKAGVKGTPKSLAELTPGRQAAHERELRRQELLRVLRRGQGLVLRARRSSTTTAGRSRRASNGHWTGALDSPRAIAGLNAFKNTFLALSRASKSTDEANPFPTVPFSQGHAASFVGPGWQFGYALDPKAGNPKLKPFMGAFPMPSHTKGKTMPAFIGGSDLAIPAASSEQGPGRRLDLRLHRDRRR